MRPAEPILTVQLQEVPATRARIDETVPDGVALVVGSGRSCPLRPGRGNAPDRGPSNAVPIRRYEGGGVRQGYVRDDQRLIPMGDRPPETPRVHPKLSFEVALFVRFHLLPARRARRRPNAPENGQSLVEFSLILVPLFLILLGIIQFGFIFNTYVTMTNSAREGARTGTIYIYDQTLSKDQNDALRNESIKDAVTGSMNMLSKASPQFATGGSWTSSNGNKTFTN